MNTFYCFLAQPPGADELFDIVILTPKDPVWPLILWTTSIIAILIGATALTIWVIRSRKPVGSSLSPKERATARFRSVQQRSDELKANEIMLEVSDSLKDYLAEQYNDPLRYETTQEFLARISHETTQLPTAAQEQVRGFVVAADEMKFGNTSNSRQKCLPLIETAESIVNLCEANDQGHGSNRKLPTHKV
jgi:signal transduction histidine kinase